MGGPDQPGGPNAHRVSAGRYALEGFTSQWFLIPQGTGILAVILHQLHYQFHGLVTISRCLWVLTIVLLGGMLIVYSARAMICPSYVRKQLKSNIMETACLSSISISFTTIVQMVALNLVEHWSRRWGLVALGLWWVNVVLATMACIGIPYVFTKLEAPGLDDVPVAILLPLIAALTAAAGGGVVCRYGALDATLQAPVIVVSYLSIGLGLPLSLACNAVFLARVLDKSWPAKETAYTIMILCGPLGQSSFAFLVLGDCVSRGAFAISNASGILSSEGAHVVAICSQLLGIITWGFGLFWWAFACIAILHFLVSESKAAWKWDQHLAAWSLVFPWGVFTNGALELGVILSSPAFNVISAILTVALVLLWLANAGATLVGIYNGKVFGLDHGWKATYMGVSSKQD